MATRFHNPLQMHLNHRGEMVDKYGRIFTYSPELKKKRRKDRAPQNVSYCSHLYSGEQAKP